MSSSEVLQRAQSAFTFLSLDHSRFRTSPRALSDRKKTCLKIDPFSEKCVDESQKLISVSACQFIEKCCIHINEAHVNQKFGFIKLAESFCLAIFVAFTFQTALMTKNFVYSWTLCDRERERRFAPFVSFSHSSHWIFDIDSTSTSTLCQHDKPWNQDKACFLSLLSFVALLQSLHIGHK